MFHSTNPKTRVTSSDLSLQKKRKELDKRRILKKEKRGEGAGGKGKNEEKM
jgi:hypothetical protein